jgi:hypothetical protein
MRQAVEVLSSGGDAERVHFVVVALLLLRQRRTQALNAGGTLRTGFVTRF